MKYLDMANQSVDKKRHANVSVMTEQPCFTHMFHKVCVCVCVYLVVVAVGDGVGCDSRFLHLQEDSHGENRLSVLTTQLHQDPVTHLKHTSCT